MAINPPQQVICGHAKKIGQFSDDFRGRFPPILLIKAIGAFGNPQILRYLFLRQTPLLS